MRVLAFVKTVPVLVLLLREIVQPRKKKGRESLHQSQSTLTVGLGGVGGIFPTKSVYIHYFAIFFFSIQGQFAFSSEMTIIYQQGANSTVDRYQ